MKKINLFHDGKKVHIYYEYLEKFSNNKDPRVVKEQLNFEKIPDALSFMKGFLGSASYYEPSDDLETESENQEQNKPKAISVFDKEGLS